MIPCETVPTNEKKYIKPKPNAWAVCNEAGQAVFGNFRPWNLQRVLVLRVTSAEGEGVHPFFGAKSFLRSMVHRTEPSDSCDFFHVICSCLLVFIIVICFIHNYPNDEQHAHSCLVGFKSLFYGSDRVEELQFSNIVAASFVLPHEKDMAALTCSACQLPNKGLRRFDKVAKFKNTLGIDGLNMSEQNTCPPQPVMVMPWLNMSMVPLRLRYF